MKKKIKILLISVISVAVIISILVILKICLHQEKLKMLFTRQM